VKYAFRSNSEEFEDIKDATRISKSEKDRQHNGKKKKNKRTKGLKILKG
jgi:hypothetical protein